jgi:photosystem II stability/assembly factor-like uncharacterized protein
MPITYVSTSKTMGPIEVTLTSPIISQTIREADVVTLSATANQSGNTINRVEFFINNLLVGTIYNTPYSTTWTAPTTGSYSFKAKAYNSTGESLESTTVTINIIQSIISCSITSPVSGSNIYVGDSLTINATASQVNHAINQVQFFEDSVSKGADTSSPYSITYTPTAGIKSIKATATNDTSATQDSSAISVGVRNIPDIFGCNASGQVWQMRRDESTIWMSTNQIQQTESISFVTSNIGYIGTNNNGYIWRTTDRGRTWTQRQRFTNPVTNPIKIQSCQDGNSDHMYAIGYNGNGGASFIKTTDGWLTFGVLHDFYADGLYLKDFYVINTNTIVAFMSEINSYSGYSAIMKKSTDGGLTWTTKGTFTGIGHYYNLHMRFPTSSVGYAGCASGQMLKTTNGGESWTQIACHSDLSSMLVNALDFVDANTGYASNNNHSYLYKTIDGGNTWTKFPQVFNYGFYVIRMSKTNPQFGVIGQMYSHFAITTNGFLTTTEVLSGGANWFTDAWIIE